MLDIKTNQPEIDVYQEKAMRRHFQMYKGKEKEHKKRVLLERQIETLYCQQKQNYVFENEMNSKPIDRINLRNVAMDSASKRHLSTS